MNWSLTGWDQGYVQLCYLLELQTKVHPKVRITETAPTMAFSWLKAAPSIVGTFSVIVKSSRTFVYPSFEALLSTVNI